MTQGIFAQEGRGNGRVGGTVKDNNGNPIPGAKVILKIITGVSSGARKTLNDGVQNNFEQEGKTTENVENGYQMEIISDKKGQWGIFGFATGQFLLTAEKEGYEAMSDVVSLSQLKRNPLIHIVMQRPEQIEPEAKKESPAESGLKSGNVLYNEGKYEEALLRYQELISKNPDLFELGINQGNCYMALKKYREAIKAFTDVIEGYKKKNAELKGMEKVAVIYANIAESYSILGELENATDYYKKSMEILPPTDAAVAYNTAEILFNSGKVDEAIAYYSLASKLKPGTAIYYIKLGYAYMNKGDIPQALTHFEKFLKLAPGDPQAGAIKELIKELK
jgi:tetratricopeptide (TPR) repeat protein